MTRLALLLLALAVAALAIGSMWEDSATADEAAHIAAGLLKLREGRLEFYATQAPLAEVLAAAPLAIAGYRVPDEWRALGNRPWVAGHMLLYRAGYDPQRILRTARLPVVALFLALCFAVFWFVREATRSDACALAAFALTGFCPTLLAHGRLATVDMALTFFAFAATALLLRLLQTSSTSSAIGCGVALACAMASKVSGALLVPFFVVVIAVWFLRERRVHIRALIVAAVSTLIAFVAIYWLVGRSLDPTLPFRAYLGEVAAVRGFYSERHVLPQFLLGEFSKDGWPYYSLVAMAVKTPLPALALFVLATLPAILKRRFEVIVCVLFAALFLLMSAFSTLNIGIRHVLPIFPFLYAGAAVSLCDAARPIRVAAIALVIAHALIAVLAYPSYLSYFNPLIGSARNADRVLIDSNLDWGQDLRRLERWRREHGIDVLRVHYFGAGSVEHELGAHGLRWSAPRPEPLPKGWFALSRHYYRLSFLRARSPVDYDTYLRVSHAQYVTTVGGSIDIYRVR
jgi:hypothetical protein